MERKSDVLTKVEYYLSDKKKGDKYRKILEYCLEPKVFDIRSWESATKLTMQDMGEIIANLVKAGGLVYKDGRYVVTDKGLNAL